MNGLALAAPAVAPTFAEITTADVDGAAAARLPAGLRELYLTELPATPAVDLVFEDLESVLGEHAEVAREDLAPLAQRLHIVFRRLVRLSRMPSSGVKKATVEASWAFMTELMPHDLPGARGYLRRLALAVSDLLDQLLEDMP